MSRSPGAYSWLPGFLRKFLNLDDELPNYGGSSYSAPSSSAPSARPAITYTPPARPTASYTPPEPQRYVPNSPPPTSTPRFAGGPPAPTAPAYGTSGPAAGGVAPSAPPAPSYVPPPGATVSPGASLPQGLPEGYVQPVGYLLRSYARGALPPQGLEQFTRESRATLTDVWNFYSYWTRFQTEELTRIGRDLLDIVTDNAPTGADGGTTGGRESIRRIKVTTANGDDRGIDRVATTTTVDPPPVPTPAAPPTPPPTTAVFSPTVTADDAQVPPQGRSIAVEFQSQAAENAAQVQADSAADSAAARDALARAAQEAAGTASDTAKDLGDTAKDAAKDAADAAKDLGDDLKGRG